MTDADKLRLTAIVVANVDLATVDTEAEDELNRWADELGDRNLSEVLKGVVG